MKRRLCSPKSDLRQYSVNMAVLKLLICLRCRHLHAFQRGRRGLGHGDTGQVARAVTVAVEDNHLVLARTAEHLLGRPFAAAFNEHFKRLADVAAVALGAQFVLKGYHLLEPAQFHGLGHVVGQVARGVGAGALAV